MVVPGTIIQSTWTTPSDWQKSAPKKRLAWWGVSVCFRSARGWGRDMETKWYPSSGHTEEVLCGRGLETEGNVVHLQTFWLWGELVNVRVIRIDMLRSAHHSQGRHLSKYGFQTESSGTVDFRFNIIHQSRYIQHLQMIIMLLLSGCSSSVQRFQSEQLNHAISR